MKIWRETRISPIAGSIVGFVAYPMYPPSGEDVLVHDLELVLTTGGRDRVVHPHGVAARITASVRTESVRTAILTAGG